MWFEKLGATNRTPRTPSRGSRTSGSIEVTASGAASVTHHTAIHNTTATTCFAGPSSDPVGMTRMKPHNAGPNTRPTAAAETLCVVIICGPCRPAD
jgi:hypothetical protein